MEATAKSDKVSLNSAKKSTVELLFFEAVLVKTAYFSVALSTRCFRGCILASKMTIHLVACMAGSKKGLVSVSSKMMDPSLVT